MLAGEFQCYNKSTGVTNEIREWTANYNISQTALKAVVKIMNNNFLANISSDPRTIMKTPKSQNFVKIGNEGTYWHQGLEFCLRNCFKNITKPISISINVNIDGLPIHKSTLKCFWPILFNIFEYPNIRPMSIGIFYGESKPDNVVQYMMPFAQEAEPLLRNGLYINGHKIQIRIRCFICDSPARAFIKGILYIFLYMAFIYMYMFCRK